MKSKDVKKFSSALPKFVNVEPIDKVGLKFRVRDSTLSIGGQKYSMEDLFSVTNIDGKIMPYIKGVQKDRDCIKIDVKSLMILGLTTFFANKMNGYSLEVLDSYITSMTDVQTEDCLEWIRRYSEVNLTMNSSDFANAVKYKDVVRHPSYQVRNHVYQRMYVMSLLDSNAFMRLFFDAAETACEMLSGELSSLANSYDRIQQGLEKYQNVDLPDIDFNTFLEAMHRKSEKSDMVGYNMLRMYQDIGTFSAERLSAAPVTFEISTEDKQECIEYLLAHGCRFYDYVSKRMLENPIVVKMTNVGSLGFFIILDLFCFFHEQFGEPFSASIDFDMSDYSDAISDCLGDDFVADWLNNKFRDVDEKDYFMNLYNGYGLSNDGVFLQNAVSTDDLNGKKGLHSAIFDFKYSLYSVKAKGEAERTFCNVTDVFVDWKLQKEAGSGLYSTLVATVKDMQGVLADFLAQSDYEITDDEDDEVAEREKQSLRSEVRVLTDRLNSSTEKAEKDKKASEEEIMRLQSELEACKESLREERQAKKAIESEFKKVFSDETAATEEVEELMQVPLNEMLDYVNNFKILIIGGQIGFRQQLEELGLENVVFVTEEGDLRGGAPDVDFVCTMTKFVAHKLVHQVRSKVKTDSDTYFYFNGTNPEMLIEAYYKHARKILEED